MDETLDDRHKCCRGGCLGCDNRWFSPASLLDGICPHHDRPSLFYKCQWTTGDGVSLCYTIYRFSAVLVIATLLVTDCILEGKLWYNDCYVIWFIFYTNWNLLFIVLASFVMFILTGYRYICKRISQTDCSAESGEVSDSCIEDTKAICGGYEFLWVAHNLAANSSFTVSTVFWINFLVDEQKENWVSLTKHTINSAFILIDGAIHAIPIRIHHAIYSMAAQFVYAFVNIVYYLNDGVGPGGLPYTYKLLDWSHPLAAILMCLACLVVCLIAQIVLYALYRIRTYLSGKLMERHGFVKFGQEVTSDEQRETDFMNAPKGMAMKNGYESITGGD